jgi:putative phage-type endonuclease
MNRDEWHDWRGKGLGASDAPIVLGVSPWKTRQELWLEKTGQVAKEYKTNWAIDRGNRLEPLARAHYELMVGFDAPALIVEHPKYPFIRASLDGYSKSNSRVLEIKCPGKADHENALKGKVPKKYYPQIQHQLFVTGAKSADYFSFDGHNGCIVTVPPDRAFIVHMVNLLIEFWDCVLKKEKPTDKIEPVSFNADLVAI